jgi:hypothetical protein
MSNRLNPPGVFLTLRDAERWATDLYQVLRLGTETGDIRPGAQFPPLPHKALHEPGGSDALTVDAAAGVGSLRTLGTGSLQACAGNDARLNPTVLAGADIHAHWKPGTNHFESWYTMPTACYGQANMSLPAANTLYVFPLVVGRSIILDRIAFYVVSGSPGDLGRAGLYDTATDGYPNALVVDGGEMDCANSGMMAATINLGLGIGLYWLAILANAPLSLKGLNSGYLLSCLGSDNQLDGVQIGISHAQTYGVLPATFPTASPTILTTTFASYRVPLIAVRRSA